MQVILRAMVAVLMVGWSQVVSAQSEPAGYPEARALALSEYQAGNFEEARAEFQRAYRLFPNARMLRGIGMSEFELRNYGESIRALEDALRSEVRPLEADLRADTEALLARARNYIARVTLELQPGSTRVTVDRVPVTLGPGNMLLLRVGDHVLEFNAEGRASERRELRVDGGEQQTMRVVLVEPPVAPTLAPPAALTRSTEPTTAAAPVEPAQASPPAQVARARRSKPKHARADESPPEGAVLMRFRADDRDDHWSLETKQRAVICTLPCVRWVAPQSGLMLRLHEPETTQQLAFLAVPNNVGYMPGSQLLVSVRAVQPGSCTTAEISGGFTFVAAMAALTGALLLIAPADVGLRTPGLVTLALAAALGVGAGISWLITSAKCNDFDLIIEPGGDRAAAARRTRLARAHGGPNVRLSGAGVVGVF